MVTNKELEKRIESLEKEVQHLKAILQYQMRNKRKWLIKVAELDPWFVYFVINWGLPTQYSFCIWNSFCIWINSEYVYF